MRIQPLLFDFSVERSVQWCGGAGPPACAGPPGPAPEKQPGAPPHTMIDPTATLLERYLDLLVARQRVTAGNIANADTPGYRAREIDFQAEMRSLLAGPREPFLPIAVRETLGEDAKNDGNNVSLDRELRVVADNVVRFNLASVLLQRHIRSLRNVIREGRGG